MSYHFAIVGGGVIGNSVAWHLTKRGCRDVVVVERGHDTAAGSAARATGGFRAQFDDEIDIRLSLLSREKLLRFRDDTGADPGYEQRGYLFLARNDSELAALAKSQALQHACGLVEAEMRSADAARALNPAITDERIVGAAFCPTDGFLRPMNILHGYMRAAQQAGARYEFGCEFQQFQTEGERAVAAITNRGEIRAETFVISLGAWAGPPIVPLRRNVAATTPTTIVPPEAPMTIWIRDWFHLRERDGRVLLLWPDDPPVADDAWLDAVMMMTRDRAAPLAGLAVAERWSGFYEMTPDGHPLVGRHPHLRNVFLAAGSCGHGVMHAPAIGQLVTELIVDGTPSIDIDALDPARFSASFRAV